MKLYLQQHKSLLISGLLSTIVYIYLALGSQAYGDINLQQLLISATFCMLTCLITWSHYYRNNKQIHLGTVLGFAILFRFLGVCTFPILEDDIYRYLWDGRATVELGSPYGFSPATFFDSNDINFKFESILGLINYPEVATIYGPSSQLLFALAYKISPGEIWPLQMLFACADITLLFVLIKLTKPLALLLYAWSPLIIKEIAITAHPDGVGALLLILAFLTYQRRNWYFTGVLLALAIGVKVFAFMLIPFLLGFKWRGWLAFIVTATLIALPFVNFTTINELGNELLSVWLPIGLKEMGSSWLFNAPLYLIFSKWFAITNIKLTLLTLLALGCATYYFYVIKNWPTKIIRGDLLFAALFICAPAFNPWYLAWLLPFAAIYPSVWAWAASYSLFFAYASGINLPNSELDSYEQPYWLVMFEFAFILFAIAIGPKLIQIKKINSKTDRVTN